MKTLCFHLLCYREVESSRIHVCGHILAYKLKSLPGQNFCPAMDRICIEYMSLSSLRFFVCFFSCSETEISISVTLTDTKLYSYTPFYNMIMIVYYLHI